MRRGLEVLYRMLLICAATCLCTSRLIGQESSVQLSPQQIEQEVLIVEQARDRAMQERNAKVLDDIYADNLCFINTRGQKFSKAERLADFGSGKVTYISYKQGDYSFHVYGDTVVMTGITSSVVKYHGRLNQTPRRFTNVYVKLGGRWRLASHQTTPVVHQP